MEYWQKEKKRPQTGLSVRMIVGAIFGGIGVIYTAVGAGLWLGGVGRDVPVLPIVFGSLGVLLLGVGGILLTGWIREKNGIREAVDGGYFVNAVITEIIHDRSVKVNGRTYMRAVCQVREGDTVHLYRSRLMPWIPEELEGRNVRVYINRFNEKYYWVDLEGLMPEVRMH